jgi:hypothetical protein
MRLRSRAGSRFRRLCSRQVAHRCAVVLPIDATLSLQFHAGGLLLLAYFGAIVATMLPR